MRIDSKGREVFPLVCNSVKLADELNKYFNWYSGVPDSVLKNTQALLSDYYFSSRENHAIAMAFGARISGKNPCLLIQNSGLGLSIDALLGLFRLYSLGVVIVVSNRGELEWEEVQHHEWGDITINLLKSLKISVIDFNKYGLKSIKIAYDKAYIKNEIVVLNVHRGNLDE